MKRLLCVSVMAGLLMVGASISWAETNLNSSKSNVAKSAEGKGKGTKSAAASAAQSQQDPCTSVKNDPKQYAKCQEAATPSGLSRRSRSKHGAY